MLDTHESHDLQTLVQDQIDSWRAGQEPNASRLLAKHPELSGAKSLVLDLALAEYTLRTEAGDKIVKSDFCDRFPAYRQSIAKLLEVQEFLDQCPQFAINEASRWPVIGDEFLGFEIVEPLGRGGLARVFLARELALGNRQVVIKVSRFASREAHTLGKLSHPSIMPVHSVQHDDLEGWTAICMPLLGAATAVDLLDAAFADDATRDSELIHRVADATRPLASTSAASPATEQFDWNLTYQQGIARLGLQLAEALSAAHATGILHRDIKPSNILLAWSGRPLLLDFNLSSDAATTLHGVGGTLAYMAPELIGSVLTDKGRAARQFDPRYDIYSLGAVLYELLTGRLPAKPTNAQSLPIDAYQPWLDCKREQPAALASEQSESAHQQLYDIVLKCLAFDPSQRFATADELAAAITQYLDSLRPTPAVQPPPRGPGRAVFAPLVFSVLIALLGLSTYFATAHFPRPNAAELRYQQGLEDYEAGHYDEAVASFTRCLELKPGWLEAQFARAQVLRKQGKFEDASVDYLATKKLNFGWATCLAGLCCQKIKLITEADDHLSNAYRSGLRNIQFLFNYAAAKQRKYRRSEAIKAYMDIVAAEPRNLSARYHRVWAGAHELEAVNKMPSEESLSQAQEYLALAPQSFESAYCAAKVYGMAARIDSSYHNQAVQYLTLALERGLPLEAIDLGSNYMLKPLKDHVDPAVRQRASHDAAYRDNPVPMFDFPFTPNWEKFVREVNLPANVSAVAASSR